MNYKINDHEKLSLQEMLFLPDYRTELSSFEVTGTGELKIVNTGGSSASEGGMGSDSEGDKAKGDLKKSDTGNTTSDQDDEDFTFDPIKKNVREAEKSKKD
jgi:hypothetical protein